MGIGEFLHIKSCVACRAGASTIDVLAVCAYSKVRRGPTNKVLASLRTCAAVLGHDSPAPLLPLLLQLKAAAEPDESAVAAASKRPYAFLLQPAEKLAARAVQLQKLYGIDREHLGRIARQFPGLVFASSSSTTKLKALLLQLQLLGDGSHVAGDKLAPEMEKMFRTCPQVC